MSNAAAVPSEGGKVTREWILVAAAIVAALATVVAAVFVAVAAIAVAALNNESDRDLQVRADRADVYAAYIADTERFDEFLWSNLNWAGEGAMNPLPADLNSTFWEPARNLQAELAGNYAMGRIWADDDVLEALQSLEQSRGEAFLRFKCMSNQQTELCEINGHPVEPSSHEAIVEVVVGWSESSGAARDDLVEAVAAQLN